MTRATFAQARAVSCPICSAEPGHPCALVHGRALRYELLANVHHCARYRAAEQGVQK
jgi:hypothetical protein